MMMQSLWWGPLIVTRGEIIAQVAAPPARVKLTPRAIVEQVAHQHGLVAEQLIGASRLGPIVKARHEAMYRLRNETKLSAPQIARALGRTDHSTVLWGVKRHAERIAA
jgi:chromosomal replication initiation ATPase DnaA